MNRKIDRACHALALDEERELVPSGALGRSLCPQGNKLYAVDDDWKPAPSDPDQALAAIDRERISQVWFVGVHSDIGGGYSRAGLSYHTPRMDDGARECLRSAVPDDPAKLAEKLRRSLRQAQRFAAWPCRLLSLSAAQACRDLQPASLQIVAPQRFSTHRQSVEEPAGPRARGEGRARDSRIPMSRGRIRKFIRACSTGSGSETTATPRSYCRNIMMSWAMTVPSPRMAPIAPSRSPFARHPSGEGLGLGLGAPHHLLPDRPRLIVSRGAAGDRKMVAGTRTGQPGRNRGADHRSGGGVSARLCQALA